MPKKLKNRDLGTEMTVATEEEDGCHIIIWFQRSATKYSDQIMVECEKLRLPKTFVDVIADRDSLSVNIPYSRSIRELRLLLCLIEQYQDRLLKAIWE